MTHLTNSNSDPDSSDAPTRDRPSTEAVCVEVWDERLRQDQRWGEQNHPDGTRLLNDMRAADKAKEYNDAQVANGTLTFRDILWEEVLEAFAESDPERLREELIQCAAVCVAWVEAIDRRSYLDRRQS
jgi:hypothetical protein